LLSDQKDRLKLIKERYRELILKPREEKEKELDVLYDWNDEADVLDDAVLARELRRQKDHDSDDA